MNDPSIGNTSRTRIDALDRASEIVYRIADDAVAMNRALVVREQQRLRIAAHRASGSSTTAFLAVADFDFKPESNDERDKLVALCDAALDTANQEVERLAQQIADTFPLPL